MFWKWFHKKYGNETVTRLHIPMEHWGNFNAHYFLYDNNGNVKDVASNMIEAIRKYHEKNLYITKVWEHRTDEREVK